MPQLRLAFSNRTPIENGKRTSRKKSTPSPIVLPALQLLSWKLERLHGKRPAALIVIERLVDGMLFEVEGRKL